MALNDQVYDKFVAHDVNLQRLQEHHRQLIVSELRALEVRIIKRLQTLTGETFTKKRQTALLKYVQKSIATSYGRIYRTHRTEVEAMARLEVERAPELVNQSVKVPLMSVGAPEAVIQSLLKDTAVLGAPLKRIWKQEAGALTQAFMSTMRQGILAGDTTDELIRRVRGTKAQNYQDGIFGPTERRIPMRVRTSAQSILNDARMQTYRDNDAVIKGVQAQVTLDDRTSDICMARSGSAWTLDGDPMPGTDTDEAYPGAPPWHPNCRSTLIPVLKSWGELAGNPDLDREVAKELRDVPRGTQSSMDGYVAESLTYEEWLKTKSDAFQKDVLGPGKYRLWKTGKITLKDLIDQRGHPLTLAQLKNLPPDDGLTGGSPAVPPTPVVPPNAPLQPATPDDFLASYEEPHPYNTFLSPLTKNDLVDRQLHLSADGKVGYTLNSQGDFGGLFNHGAAKGQGQVAIAQAIQQGAQTLDAFDGYLPELYAQYGFRVTGRMKFNDAFAPPNWNYARDGRPDVVFMAYQGGARGTLNTRVGKFPAYIPQSGRYYTDYDQARLDAQRTALARTDDRGARRRGSRESVAEFEDTARIRKEPLNSPSALYTPANAQGIDTLQQYLAGVDTFTAQRQILHKAIEFGTFQSASAVKNPVSYILGGGPASGKSTLEKTGLVQWPRNRAHIDPDKIKGQLPEYRELWGRRDDTAAAFAHEESSWLSKSFLGLAGRSRLNLVFDGTGDGSVDGLADKVALMRAGGQRVVAHYVTIPTDEAIRRAKERAEKTGRKVPEVQIRKTHRNVSRVFPEAIRRGLFDEFTLWDNSASRPVMIARGRRNRLEVLDQGKWQAFLKKADEKVEE